MLTFCISMDSAPPSVKVRIAEFMDVCPDDIVLTDWDGDEFPDWVQLPKNAPLCVSRGVRFFWKPDSRGFRQAHLIHTQCHPCLRTYEGQLQAFESRAVFREGRRH